MITNLGELRVGGRPTDQAPETFRLSGAASLAPRVMTQKWTDAHTEVAWFLGECFAVGALLGLFTEMVRPIRGKRHG
jgi:hypothetical protein